MVIKFKACQKTQPEVIEGGTKEFYVTIITDGEATTNEQVKDIEKFSSLTEPNICGVIVALENVIQNKLSEGKIMRFEKQSSLYPTVSSIGVEKEENITSGIINNYRPGERLKKAVNDTDFK